PLHILHLTTSIHSFPTRRSSDLIEQALTNQTSTIIDKKVKRMREYPPYLFNLSNLQGHITSKFKGWTSDKVLKVAQSRIRFTFRSEEHTSELQSRFDLVCRLLLE